MKKIVCNSRPVLFDMADDRIYCRDILSGKADTIFEGASGDFDVSCDREGHIYIICQNKSSFFYVLKYENGGWSQVCILESSTREIYDKSFSLVSSGQLQNAFYILRKQGKYALIHHILFGGHTPEIIAECDYPFPYFAITAPSGDIFCIYASDGILGFRTYRWREKRWSDFSPRHAEADNIRHISAYLDTDTDYLHIVCSSEQSGRHKVTYIGSSICEIISNGYSEIIPSIFPCDGIHIMFNFAGRLLMSQSRDNGVTFTSPEYYFDGTFSKKEPVLLKWGDDTAPDCVCYGCTLPGGDFSVCMLDEAVKKVKNVRRAFYTEQKNEVEAFAGITSPKPGPDFEILKTEIELLKQKYENNFDKRLVEVIAKRLDQIELRLSAVEKGEPAEQTQEEALNASEKKPLDKTE